MPHGPITPLGRQLRSVLAALKPHVPDAARLPSRADGLRQAATTARTWEKTLPICHPTNPLRALPNPSNERRRYSTAAVAVASEGPAHHSLEQPDTAPAKGQRHELRRAKRTRPRSANLAHELRAHGRRDIAPKQYTGKRRLADFNVRSRDRWREWHDNHKDHGTEASSPKLLRILARIIRQIGVASGYRPADSSTARHLDHVDLRYLADRGYTIENARTWASIVLEPDPFEAASAIQRQVISKGTNAVPLSIISHVLLRPYVSARALRKLCPIIWDHLAGAHTAFSKPHSADAVFTVSIRLARHARRVWPQSLEPIVENLLRFMPETSAPLPDDDLDAVARVTYLLNKMMFLLSEPTAVAPLKDSQYQEAAILRLLTFMVDATPNLQLNREGYRAVIRIQLTQRKTQSERYWASLKALSWPPWKEDKTSMDSEILPEHGISRAGETLDRMQEAGYAPKRWEQVAKLYTGWDVDSTPTIQTRALLLSWIDGADMEMGVWEARIRTTRTVQEAWACYLAFEDTNLPHSPGVILAILEKLHSEEQRQRQAEKLHIRDFQPRQVPREKLLPGDSPQVSPLPPSTHLYTYTRTSPPSVHECFVEMRKRKTPLDDRCLAFLVSNANTFRTGLAYLRYGHRQRPAVTKLLSSRPDDALREVSTILLEAYIKLLARFPNHPMRMTSLEKIDSTEVLARTRRLPREDLNLEHGIVRAVVLLQLRRPRSLVGWNAVLTALSGERCFAKAYLAKSDADAVEKGRHPDPIANGLMAYRLMQQVLDSLLSQHIDIDVVGFLALCRVTERVAMTSWLALQDTQTLEIVSGTASRSAAVKDAKELLTRQKPHWRLEQFFKLLMGEESYLDPARKTKGSPARSSELSPELSAGLPRLLTYPGPAILHAYIRALGWCGAHENLLGTVEWMVEYQSELAESRAKDRNGDVMMRRAIVALRVFLERSWMDEPGEPGELATAQPAGNDGSKPLALRRLETSAPQAVLEETRRLIEQVEEWGGWPEDEEVEEYCTDTRFDPFR